MTVSELISLLGKLPTDYEVYTAYDFMACVDEDPTIFVVSVGENKGVYICAPGACPEGHHDYYLGAAVEPG